MLLISFLKKNKGDEYSEIIKTVLDYCLLNAKGKEAKLLIQALYLSGGIYEGPSPE